MLVLVFSATYFIYNFQRLVRMNQKEIDEANIGFRMQWVYKNKQPIIFTIVIAAIILVVSLFYLNIKTIVVLAIMGFFSVVYVVRFIPYNNKWLALRDIPFLKIFVIAFVWTLVTGLLPLISKDVNQINLLHILFLSKQFLFVVAITIPFDIRDMKYDVEKGIKTFPLVVGVKITLLLGMLLLLGFVAISSYEFLVFQTITLGLWIAEIIAILLVMVLLLFSKKQQPELFYSFIIEGTSLLLAITVLLG